VTDTTDSSILQQQQQQPDYVTLAPPYTTSELDAFSEFSEPSDMTLPNLLFPMSPIASPGHSLMQFTETA
jgi:hypothetical protein